jgi:hypothetical protein
VSYGKSRCVEKSKERTFTLVPQLRRRFGSSFTEIRTQRSVVAAAKPTPRRRIRLTIGVELRQTAVQASIHPPPFATPTKISPQWLRKMPHRCSGNTEVKFYKLIGGVHVWYTSPMNVSGQAPFNPNFDSNTGITTADIVWNFLASHPKA